ncbi:hypothetical protein SAMN05444371_2418 [Epilithonimonas mollis]|uniref:Uncharacterized protein n=1 Tax=Epilithonimonas mollis TaxID=216903 RepID=A0A1M6SEF8_9FLAO|nr:hypothetical protein SAMN05444371_2418 [Epilithonimonas mollis]
MNVKFSTEIVYVLNDKKDNVNHLSNRFLTLSQFVN